MLSFRLLESELDEEIGFRDDDHAGISFSTSPLSIRS